MKMAENNPFFIYIFFERERVYEKINHRVITMVTLFYQIHSGIKHYMNVTS